MSIVYGSIRPDLRTPKKVVNLTDAEVTSALYREYFYLRGVYVRSSAVPGFNRTYTQELAYRLGEAAGTEFEAFAASVTALTGPVGDISIAEGRSLIAGWLLTVIELAMDDYGVTGKASQGRDYLAREHQVDVKFLPESP